MTTLYLHTDTTARFHYREPDTAAIQPHLVRLAVLLDDKGDTLEWCRLVTPRLGWDYDIDAIVGHGVHPDFAKADGWDIKQVMLHFEKLRVGVDQYVAFNWDHHRKVLIRSAHDCGYVAELPVSNEEGAVDLMRAAVEIVRKPRGDGRSGYAWPKFLEAYAFFSGMELQYPHDPVERGIVMVRALRLIHHGILDADA